MDSVIAACSRESSVSLILRCKTGITRVELDKLEYCEVIRRSLLLHKTDGTVLEAAGSMDSLCESLAEHRNFLRIHRSYLVNLEHIQTITPKTLVVSSRAELPIPRGRFNEGAPMALLMKHCATDSSGNMEKMRMVIPSTLLQRRDGINATNSISPIPAIPRYTKL